MIERRRELTVAQVALLAEKTLAVEVSHSRVRRWIERGRIQRNACGAIDGESVLRYLDRRVREQHDDEAC